MGKGRQGFGNESGMTRTTGAYTSHIHPGGNMLKSMITSAFDLPGHDIEKSLGMVRGITVRSRSIVGNIFGALQSLFTFNITIYTTPFPPPPTPRFSPHLLPRPAFG